MPDQPTPPIIPPSSTPACFIPATDQDLSDEITRLAGHINAAQYRFLKLLAALVERKAWGGDSGMKSPAHWLNYYCGIDLGAGREKVRVAKCLPSLPLIDQAFASGAISYSKVRAMTRTATADNEDYLLNIAKHGTTAHVEMLVRKTQRAQRLNASRQDKAQYAARAFSWYHDDDGMLVFKGRLCAEDGAVFLKAMDAVLDQLRNDESGHARREAKLERKNSDNKTSSGEIEAAQSQNPLESTQTTEQITSSTQNQTNVSSFTEVADVSAETFLSDFTNGIEKETAKQTFSQKKADALVFMSEHLLATVIQGQEPEQGQFFPLKPLSAGDKYQVMVHIDATTATSDHLESAQGLCQLDESGFRSPLAARTLRRLACDASVVPVLENDAGDVLNVGRKTRSIPPAIRRALLLRDRGCRFPGCCEFRFVDGHHIQHWCDGGETSLINLVLLCRHHHRLLHQGVFSIAVVSSYAGSDLLNTIGYRKKPAKKKKKRTQHWFVTNSA